MTASNPWIEQLPSKDAAELEVVVARFEAVCRQGQSPVIDAYLPQEPVQRRAVLIELVHTDLECRLKAGQAPRVEEYLKRYPELAEYPGVAIDLIVREMELRRHRQPEIQIDEFLARFPQYQVELLARQTTNVGASTPPMLRAPAALDLAATVAGRYQMEKEIARGGMAEVWRARDRNLDRALAIKVLQERFAGEPELERRFLEEAQITGQLQHPGIPPVHEIGTLPDGRPFLAMKLIKGRTLDELLAERSSPLDELPRFLGIFETVCQTMAYAHSRGVIHRDLKPSNIMVGAFSEVQVMDWGLAKVLGRQEEGEPGFADSGTEPGTDASTVVPPAGEDTKAGAVMGTLAYMAPEQARGEVGQLDERCDVFGLGAILCVLLTGQPPYGRASRNEIQTRAVHGDLGEALDRLRASGADPDLLLFAGSCLAASREDRPRDAGAVAGRITAYLARVQERLRAAEVERAAAQARGRGGGEKGDGRAAGAAA